MASPDDSSEDSTRPHSRSSRDGGGGRNSGSDRDRPVNLAKTQLPISLVITLIVMAVSAAGSWWQLSAHAQSQTIHLNEKAVIEGGGVAYKNDILKLRWDFEHRLTKMLRSVVVNCKYSAKGGFDSVCTVTVPEPDE